jgi:hypothetical protein
MNDKATPGSPMKAFEDDGRGSNAYDHFISSNAHYYVIPVTLLSRNPGVNALML